MASGQPTTLTRMLAATIASDRPKATISNQVTGLPQSVNATANSDTQPAGPHQANAAEPASPGRWRCARGGGEGRRRFEGGLIG